MNGFWDLKCTDTRTNERTNGGEFKGPNRLRRGTNKIDGMFHGKSNKPAMLGSLGNVLKTKCQKVQEMLILNHFWYFLYILAP